MQAHCQSVSRLFLKFLKLVACALRALVIESILLGGVVDSQTLWTYSLIAGVAVILVVAVLLILIIVTARNIDRHAKNIWTAGKNIAANTAAIWLLQETNGVAGQILSGAGAIVDATASIDKKLDTVAQSLR